MKTLEESGNRIIIKEIKSMLASNNVLPPDRYAGACTPGASDSATFRSNHSYGYALSCKAALSNTPDPQSSGIFMKYPGWGRHSINRMYE